MEQGARRVPAKRLVQVWLRDDRRRDDAGALSVDRERLRPVGGGSPSVERPWKGAVADLLSDELLAVLGLVRRVGQAACSGNESCAVCSSRCWRSWWHA